MAFYVMYAPYGFKELAEAKAGEFSNPKGNHVMRRVRQANHRCAAY
jgi:hypothetical protein